ncbi:HAMP domain-containing protein [Agrobacterium tumefaciens]|uniref:HAMP domain-containing protein n=1 Tax=Agrobacterium tumefaciens TaxID=358 RepID=A0AA44F5X5_AGRTU|nr:nitrate- and nitrite sensing domain-containing protein [Agrobacterium tumefaciens]NSL21213.1 HAMP domain-containing protein [Agrobacterium tumefaciens]NTB83785.1 HAMP domain-containing protein [Agrobacterium tumefaciens]NTC20746.1 HAMP domain-containing protein [Agrobacterium tumefaciens]NTC29256.1 HAMP domain-containing protein [Agrobacterium tumefaciens]NTC57536.1 HAMP domain-containing protein [Agrobacterium tumefaciens]
MLRIMGRISLQKALYGAILLPLFGMSCLGGMKIWESYGAYENARQVTLVQQVANASGELAQALPAEMFALPANAEDARARTDKAFAELFESFDTFTAEAGSDPIFDENYKFINDNKERWYNFRRLMIANHDRLDDALFAEGSKLVPLPTAAIDIVRHAGTYAQDHHIAGLLRGYYALMQISEASTMEMVNGTAFLAKGNLTALQRAFVVNAKVNFANFQNTALEQLPEVVIRPYKNFLGSEEQKFVNTVRATLYAHSEPGKADSEALARWNSVTGERHRTLEKAFLEARQFLKGAALENLAAARLSLTLFSAITLGLVVLTALMSIMVVTNITQALRRIKNRMSGLAEGDTLATVPDMLRIDEVGEMARAVEQFRLNAIERRALEQDAETLKMKSETERAEVQATAERDAAGKLRVFFGIGTPCAAYRGAGCSA